MTGSFGQVDAAWAVGGTGNKDIAYRVFTFKNMSLGAPDNNTQPVLATKAQVGLTEILGGTFNGHVYNQGGSPGAHVTGNIVPANDGVRISLSVSPGEQVDLGDVKITVWGRA